MSALNKATYLNPRTIDDFLEEIYQQYKRRYFWSPHLPSLSNSDSFLCDTSYNNCSESDVAIQSDSTSNKRASLCGVEMGPMPSNSSWNDPSSLLFTTQIIQRIKNRTRSILGHIQRQCRRCQCLNINNLCNYRHYFPLPLLALCISNSSDATEILMLSYLLANPTFRQDIFTNNHDNLDSNNLDENNSNQNIDSNMEGAEYLAASMFLGMLLGGTLIGLFSDSFLGRRPSLLLGLCTNCTAGMLSSFPFLSPTYVELTRWRFLAGVGIGATVPPLFSLASEWSPREIRGGVVTAVASFWMVGSLFVSGLAWCLFQGEEKDHYHRGEDDANVNAQWGGAHSYGIPLWRVFAALCALPSGLGAWMVYCYVPESPRFLASAKGEYERSACVCNRMAETWALIYHVGRF